MPNPLAMTPIRLAAIAVLCCLHASPAAAQIPSSCVGVRDNTARLGCLAKRRRELDARENQLSTQANMIAAAEARVDAKINQLKQLQAQINGLVTQRDEAQKTQIATLTKAYSTMKAKDAAKIFDTLDPDVLTKVARAMDPRKMSPILAALSPETAQRLTTAFTQSGDTNAVAAANPAGGGQNLAALPQIVGH